ncbi:universal stress protein [Luteolibacter sp. AS25]|uniref:universal stress protein n=1 Tax=Luteolibacter sp. AS25 TaxID=3135776 RepID=UPI00398A9C65
MSTILACTDGSLYGRSIYQHAAWAANKLSSPVHVLHAIEREEVPATHDLSGNIGFYANAELLAELSRLDESHARVARLRGSAILEDAKKQLEGLSVETTQRHGALVDAVLDYEKDASLVVIGKRGEHADFSKGHLGSNLERVVRSTKLPVLVAAREFKPVERFTVAFDGGPSSLKAIHYLATEALLKGAICDLVTIGKPDSEAAKAQDSAAVALKGAGYQVNVELLSGDADEIISGKVSDSGSDLLVMGAYGHSKVRQFILGSTTTTLIRTCQVPILLFR